MPGLQYPKIAARQQRSPADRVVDRVALHQYAEAEYWGRHQLEQATDNPAELARARIALSLAMVTQPSTGADPALHHLEQAANQPEHVRATSLLLRVGSLAARLLPSDSPRGEYVQAVGNLLWKIGAGDGPEPHPVDYQLLHASLAIESTSDPNILAAAARYHHLQAVAAFACAGVTSNPDSSKRLSTHMHQAAFDMYAAAAANDPKNSPTLLRDRRHNLMDWLDVLLAVGSDNHATPGSANEQLPPQTGSISKIQQEIRAIGSPGQRLIARVKGLRA